MALHQCPNCGLRVASLRAPDVCPRCAAHHRGTHQLIPVPIVRRNLIRAVEATARGPRQLA